MITSLKKVFATTHAIQSGRASSRLVEHSLGSENEPCFPSTNAYPGFLLGVVRRGKRKEVLKQLQSTAHSALASVPILPYPKSEWKDDEYFWLSTKSHDES